MIFRIEQQDKKILSYIKLSPIISQCNVADYPKLSIVVYLHLHNHVVRPTQVLKM